MRNQLKVFLVLSFWMGSAVSVNATATAEQCGVNAERTPPVEILANSGDAGKWMAYKKIEDIPPLSGGREAALVWAGAEGKLFVLLELGDEDWDTYTEYCFNGSRLWRLRYELRTAWGWGFREEGKIVEGKVKAQTAEFFDTGNDRTMPKPEMADEVPDALRPILYPAKKRLPFYELLPRALTANDRRQTANGFRANER